MAKITDFFRTLEDGEEPPPRKVIKEAEVAQSRKRPVGRPRKRRPILVNLVDDATAAGSLDSTLGLPVVEGAFTSSTATSTAAVTPAKSGSSSRGQFMYFILNIT